MVAEATEILCLCRERACEEICNVGSHARPHSAEIQGPHVLQISLEL